MPKEDLEGFLQALSDALERLKKGEIRPDDVRIVKQAQVSGQVAIASEGAVAIGGNVSGSTIATLVLPPEVNSLLQRLTYKQPQPPSSSELSASVGVKLPMATSLEADDVSEGTIDVRRTTADNSSMAIGRDAKNNIIINIAQPDPHLRDTEEASHEDSASSSGSLYIKPKFSDDYEQIYGPHRIKLFEIFDMDMRILEVGISSDQNKILECQSASQQLDENVDERKKLEETIQKLKCAKNAKMAELMSLHSNFENFNPVRSG